VSSYKLSNAAKEDLIPIHHWGTKKFGPTQADKYFDNFFSHFEIIGRRPYSFEAVDYLKTGYRRCPYGSDSIYYRIENGFVEIMTVIGKQDLENL